MKKNRNKLAKLDFDMVFIEKKKINEFFWKNVADVCSEH